MYQVYICGFFYVFFFKVNEQVKSPLRLKLESWLNKNMRIEMTDGRVLIGIFLCTDRDRNVILGSCAEYLQAESTLMIFLKTQYFSIPPPLCVRKV